MTVPVAKCHSSIAFKLVCRPAAVAPVHAWPWMGMGKCQCTSTEAARPAGLGVESKQGLHSLVPTMPQNCAAGLDYVRKLRKYSALKILEFFMCSRWYQLKWAK